MLKKPIKSSKIEGIDKILFKEYATISNLIRKSHFGFSAYCVIFCKRRVI